MTQLEDTLKRLSIERRHDLSHAQFVHDYLMLLKPVILTDALTPWPALGKWTPEMFKRKYGHVDVTVDGKDYKLGQFIDLAVSSSREHPAPYLRNQLLADWLPELIPDITPLPTCTEPNWLESKLFLRKKPLTSLEIFIGGEGSEFPVLHYDYLHVHAFLMQIYGRKLFVVYPPEQTPFLYAKEGVDTNKSNVGDLDNVDLRKFPCFANAVPTSFILEAGETLFVPAGWWHTTRMLSPSITMSANTANESNWAPFIRDFVTNACTKRPYLRPLRRAMAAYLSVIGYVERARWRRHRARAFGKSPKQDRV
jgi:histone arginine demethylase JMJD6